MTMLYSVNIRILMNRANLPLMKTRTIISDVMALTEGFLPYTASPLPFLSDCIFSDKEPA